MENNLRKIREEKGITQEELAEMAGISRVTISKLETNGSEGIKLSTMKALGKALDVSIESIFLE